MQSPGLYLAEGSREERKHQRRSWGLVARSCPFPCGPRREIHAALGAGSVSRLIMSLDQRVRQPARPGSLHVRNVSARRASQRHPEVEFRDADFPVPYPLSPITLRTKGDDTSL